MDAVLSATVVIIRVNIWSSCDSDSRSGDCIKSGKLNEVWCNVSSPANATRQCTYYHMFGYSRLSTRLQSRLSRQVKAAKGNGEDITPYPSRPTVHLYVLPI